MFIILWHTINTFWSTFCLIHTTILKCIVLCVVLHGIVHVCFSVSSEEFSYLCFAFLHVHILSLFSCSFLFLSCIFSFAFYIPSCTHSVLVSWQISLPRFQLFVLSFYIPPHISFAFLVFHCFCWIYLDVAIMLVNSWMRSNERVIGGTWCGGKNVVNIRSPIQVLTPPDRA